MSTVSVRYIVDDVDAAITFYCKHLGFKEMMHPDPAFAMLTRGDLRLVLAAPLGPDHPGGGSRPMPDGAEQRPGGEVADPFDQAHALEVRPRDRGDIERGDTRLSHRGEPLAHM